MLKLSEYEYPNQVTFSEAVDIAKVAITSFGGMMSNKDMAEKLGYKVKNPNAISGYIFRKFDDVCAYGLMKRERGGLRVTDIASEALDPYDSRKADEGKAKALRQMPIVKKAYEEWKGEIPQETAFPAKLMSTFGISWQEAQKHSESLRKLFAEVFPYITTVSGLVQTKQAESETRGEAQMGVELRSSFTVGQILGELRTEEYGILKIKDAVSIDIALRILQSLKEKLEASKASNMESKEN